LSHNFNRIVTSPYFCGLCMRANFDSALLGSSQRGPHKQKWVDAIFLNKECRMPGCVNRRLQTLKLRKGETTIFRRRYVLWQESYCANPAETHLHFASSFNLPYKCREYPRACNHQWA